MNPSEATTIQRFIVDNVTPTLSFKGYSIYPINDKYASFFRETGDYVGTDDTLDGALDSLMKHIYGEDIDFKLKRLHDYELA